MKFFFPDSQDQIDPGFDFVTEEYSPTRVRQRDDLYVHEVLGRGVIDGLLVSKAIVDGRAGARGKYTLAQRHRLYRVGVRQFFRLQDAPPDFLTMGDCGAFSYFSEDVPPYTPDEVIDFCDECGFDIGIAPDHIIFGFDPDGKADLQQLRMWEFRKQLTVQLADEFLRRCEARRVRFTPMAVAHGWSPQSYASSVAKLQAIGYERIALGGMVPLKTREIISSLLEISKVRLPQTQLHLLGIMREESVDEFAALGVASFDSTSAFRQSFKDDRDNYHTSNRSYTAIRIPQTEGNARLKKSIEAGRIVQEDAIRLERQCMTALLEYAGGDGEAERILRLVREYGQVIGNRKDYAEAYGETLQDAPWKKCGCRICHDAGINVIIFRGSERIKRRGFHNLYAFRQRIDGKLQGRRG